MYLMFSFYVLEYLDSTHTHTHTHTHTNTHKKKNTSHQINTTKLYYLYSEYKYCFITAKTFIRFSFGGMGV